MQPRWLKDLQRRGIVCSENKGIDQLRGYHAADLHIRFVHMQKAEFLMAKLIIKLSSFFSDTKNLRSLLRFEEIQ